MPLYKVLMAGRPKSGKTSLIMAWKLRSFIEVAPTLVERVERFDVQTTAGRFATLEITEMPPECSGAKKVIKDFCAAFYVVDARDLSQVEDVRSDLSQLQRLFSWLSVIVLLNKIDSKAARPKEWEASLQVHNADEDMKVMFVSALNHQGLQEALDLVFEPTVTEEV
ncbi:MAG: uncharacterized protein KVP18_001980 [Porospora cf. gigantea A]|uniref:uncharacterized protein n=1 Tax=Porospora cf. gigantea A TaxID=2853593 RepID=UPI003559C2B5|nr:MAG: hypothetical protein KVP18_001980 [Porospora cf. gigantea A]